MAKNRVPEDVTVSIRQSIEASAKGSRRVRCHSLRELFGFQAWTAQRRELVASHLERQGIRTEPSVVDAGLHDWIVLSLPSLPPPSELAADPRPPDEWFDHLMSVHLDSEREVEMYFASPLFHGLGYSAEHEAAGFRFDMWEGVARKRVEADLIYFLDHRHSLDEGTPLILVEAKSTSQPPGTGTGQARIYAFWVKPAYYVVTNGDVTDVYNYQGTAPDVPVLTVKRTALRDQFDDLYRMLSPGAAAEARQVKIERLNRLK